MKVLILGMGKSGIGVKELLDKCGCETCFAKDEDVNSENLSDEKLDRLFFGLSFIVVSPGISLDKFLMKSAKKRRIKIFGELEVSSWFAKGEIVAVTGTNGKTTVVNMINYLLSFQNKKTYLCGNVGVPISSFALITKKEDFLVVECSSFQLETVEKFQPKIACVLNVTEDHLNRHKTMKKYFLCKAKITKNQSKKDCLILNADDEFLSKNKVKTKAQIYYFSLKKEVVGCYLKNKIIYFNDGKSKKKLLRLDKINVVGEHNFSNILASILSVYLLTKNTEILKNIKTFKGVPHRIEFVRKIKNISFFNDSKSTNVDSTIVAINSFKNKINLILGGLDKNLNYDILFQKITKNIDKIAIFGQNKFKIAFSADKYNFKNYQIFENFKDAILFCFNNSKPNYVVLLSPASASFDMFSGYEERGNIFKKIVEEIDFCENKFLENKEKK